MYFCSWKEHFCEGQMVLEPATCLKRVPLFFENMKEVSYFHVFRQADIVIDTNTIQATHSSI